MNAMIRPARTEDASRLAEILIFAKRTAYRPIFQNDVVSFQEMQVLELALQYRDMPGMLKDVYVFDDGIVKGMMSWGQTDSRVWELRELYVEPFFQGHRVGGILMKNFLSKAAEHGCNGVFLWVLEANRRARDFYESFGFRPGTERELVPETQAYMVKYLKWLEGKSGLL